MRFDLPRPLVSPTWLSRLALFSIIVLPVFGGITMSQAQLPPISFQEGQPFPDLVLPAAHDGRPLSLADFRGQKVVLHIFASW